MMWPLDSEGSVTQQDFINPTGIINIIDGAGGNLGGHDKGDPTDITAFMNTEHYGFCEFTFVSSGSLSVTFWGAKSQQPEHTINIVKQH